MRSSNRRRRNDGSVEGYDLSLSKQLAGLGGAYGRLARIVEPQRRRPYSLRPADKDGRGARSSQNSLTGRSSRQRLGNHTVGDHPTRGARYEKEDLDIKIHGNLLVVRGVKRPRPSTRSGATTLWSARTGASSERSGNARDRPRAGRTVLPRRSYYSHIAEDRTHAAAATDCILSPKRL